MNTNRLAQIILLIALLLTTIAVSLVLTKKKHLITPVFTKEEILVKQGDTLTKLLSDNGLSAIEIDEISKILKKDADVTILRADSDKIVLKKDKENNIKKIVVIPSNWKHVELKKENDTWCSKIVNIDKNVRFVYKTGEIKEGDSFYLAGMRADIPAGILAEVYDLLAFEMDFERDVRAGQDFSVLYEENYSGDNKVENGRVIAVSFQALRGKIKMYRFKRSDEKIGYYDTDGTSAIKTLKRTPINNAKVSSSFNLNRKHPILGFTRAHKGVDFRAPMGTPIPSAGSGRVVAKGFNKGHGNFIRVRHNGSFDTLYAHLSKFVKNVGVGTVVKQGQIIGYVGMTGLATGPHLHYEIIRDGKHVNPMTVKLPTISSLVSKDKEKFEEIRKQIDTVIKILDSKKCILEL